jgi:luciferase family oxidoreductase group 1
MSKELTKMPLSVLDLCPIVSGGSAADAFARMLDLARLTESLGYRRFWVAEHHNMPGIASAATSVVIGHLAQGTEKIRIGSGGIMLLNHSPLVIAEQFGTLQSLFPGRIDLGLGRAPGTDQTTVRLLRQDPDLTGEEFPERLDELQSLLGTPAPGQRIRAVPGAGLSLPIWLLGSGGFSAQLAGQLGLPFASAGHFSPDNPLAGLELYRRGFRPSRTLTEPYAMVGINVFAAETDEEAIRLATSHLQAHLSLARGAPIELPLFCKDQPDACRRCRGRFPIELSFVERKFADRIGSADCSSIRNHRRPHKAAPSANSDHVRGGSAWARPINRGGFRKAVSGDRRLRRIVQ